MYQMTELPMVEEEMPETRFEKVMHKLETSKWVVYGAPVLISILIGTRNPQAGVQVFVFFVLAYGVFYLMGLIMKVIGWFTSGIAPKSRNPKAVEIVQETTGSIVLLSGFATLGAVLRGDNVISRFAIEHLPGGMSVSFVDPTFAFVVCVGAVVYAWVRLFWVS